MKKARNLPRSSVQLRVVATFVFSVLFSLCARSQGRVLINEYLAWPGQDCGASAEFVELLNFGPGPMDIGCWVLTDGDYAITIPPNTILQPGNYYVLAGSDVIQVGCANLNRTITANLNWNKGSFANAAIPASGLLTDGGGGGEQLVLFNSAHEVIDAIARYPEPSSSITTSPVTGCEPWTFDLDEMNIRYELIGEAQGRNNSYARRIDGGCGWLKDTHQSAGDQNNTAGNVALFSASLSVVQPLSCEEKGYAVVHILQADYAGVFPMKYVLGRDVDSNGVYDDNDEYKYGIDSIPSNIELGELESGKYRVVVETNNGCDLQSLDFNILDCYSALLAAPIRSFRLSKRDEASMLQWDLNHELKFSQIQLQVSRNNAAFKTVFSSTSITEIYHGVFIDQDAGSNNGYRIIATDVSGNEYYSAILRANTGSVNGEQNLMVVAVRDVIRVQVYSRRNAKAVFGIVDLYGHQVVSKKTALMRGTNSIAIEPGHIQPGIYILQMVEEGNDKRRAVKFYYTR